MCPALCGDFCFAWLESLWKFFSNQEVLLESFARLKVDQWAFCMFVLPIRDCWQECQLCDDNDGNADDDDDDDNGDSDNENDVNNITNWKGLGFADPNRMSNHGNDHNSDDDGGCGRLQQWQ